jgi:hypothetical protein
MGYPQQYPGIQHTPNHQQEQYIRYQQQQNQFSNPRMLNPNQGQPNPYATGGYYNNPQSHQNF